VLAGIVFHVFHGRWVLFFCSTPAPRSAKGARALLHG
jgi:hypothetical protein